MMAVVTGRWLDGGLPRLLRLRGVFVMLTGPTRLLAMMTWLRALGARMRWCEPWRWWMWSRRRPSRAFTEAVARRMHSCCCVADGPGH